MCDKKQIAGKQERKIEEKKPMKNWALIKIF